MVIQSILRRKGKDVHTAKSTITVEEAIHIMWKHEISALVVCDDGRRIDGIISDRAIIRGLADQGTELMQKPIGELMTREVLTCTANDRVSAVMGLMTDRRIRHIPVVDDQGMLDGLVSIGDVVKHRIDEIRDEADHMRDYIKNPW